MKSQSSRGVDREYESKEERARESERVPRINQQMGFFLHSQEAEMMNIGISIVPIWKKQLHYLSFLLESSVSILSPLLHVPDVSFVTNTQDLKRFISGPYG